MFTPQFLGPEPKDWFNYTVVRAPKDSLYHVIIHRDTGSILTPQYQGYLIEGYLATKQLSMFIKTKADVYRFFAFCNELYAQHFPRGSSYGEPRASCARRMIEAEKSQYARSVEQMIEAIVLQKSACSSIFKTFGFEFREEFEKRYGRDGLKRISKFPPTGYPVVRKTVPPALAKKALAKWFTIHGYKPNDFTFDRKRNAYWSTKVPLATFYVSFFFNQGNHSIVDGHTLYIFEKHSVPKAYLKKGDRFTTSREPGIWKVTELWTRSDVNQALQAKNEEGKSSLFFLWDARTYMFAGSNGGICGFRENLRKVA